MDTHKRYFCNTCAREWVDPTFCFTNSRPERIFDGFHCFTCGSEDIKIVEYKPAYAGLDIPRSMPLETLIIASNYENNKIEIQINSIEKNSIYDLSDMD